MSQQTRILIGLAVLFGGLLFLARRYYTTRSHQNAEVVITETTDFVESALSSTSYTVSPTSETIPSIIKQVQLSVVEQGRGLQAISQLGPTGVDDLGEVFAERLRFLTVPDLERDYRASASRGDPLSKEEWFDRYRSYQQSVLDRRAIPAMNPTGVKVSVLSLGIDLPPKN